MIRTERPADMLVRDALLTVAYDIYTNEHSFITQESMEDARYQKKWEPVTPQAFSAPISLGKLIVGKAGRIEQPEDIMSATFSIDDEEGGMITVSPEADPSLYEGEYARDFLGRIEDVFYGHFHSFCYQALRKQREEKVAKPRTPLVALRGTNIATINS